MTRKTVLFFALWACAVAAFAGAGPIVVCESFFHFGTRDSGGTVEHSFVIQNKGDEVLEISKTGGCCGAEVTLSIYRIEAGRSAEVKIVLSLEKRHGPVSKSIYLANNSANDPLLHLELVGYCR